MPLNHNDLFVVNAATPARRQIIEFKLSEEVLEEIMSGRQSLQLDMGQSVSLVVFCFFFFLPLCSCSRKKIWERRGVRMGVDHCPEEQEEYK